MLLGFNRNKSNSIELLRKTVIPCGVIVFLISLVIVLGNIGDIEKAGKNIAVSVLSLLYSIIEYLALTVIENKKK